MLKFSQPINFNYELFYFFKYIKNLNNSLCSHFSLMKHLTNYGPKKIPEIVFKMWVYRQNVGV
jgi:hypothetical protein